MYSKNPRNQESQVKKSGDFPLPGGNEPLENKNPAPPRHCPPASLASNLSSCRSRFFVSSRRKEIDSCRRPQTKANAPSPLTTRAIQGARDFLQPPCRTPQCQDSLYMICIYICIYIYIYIYIHIYVYIRAPCPHAPFFRRIALPWYLTGRSTNSCLQALRATGILTTATVVPVANLRLFLRRLTPQKGLGLGKTIWGGLLSS